MANFSALGMRPHPNAVCLCLQELLFQEVHGVLMRAQFLTFTSSTRKSVIENAVDYLKQCFSDEDTNVRDVRHLP